MKQKVCVWLDHWLWQDFYRLFPSHGARSAFLREMILKAIELGPQSSVVKQVLERIKKDETTDEDNW